MEGRYALPQGALESTPLGEGRLPSAWGAAVSPGSMFPQEETVRKEKQQLLDEQRQAALEREVCLPPLFHSISPSVHLLCPGHWGSKLYWSVFHKS
jgi:hypothetical protein